MAAQKKRHFYILLDGMPVGENWAVSADKAINNYWWVHDKQCSPYTYTEYRPEDYDAVEI